jgi:hypothetical protein
VKSIHKHITKYWKSWFPILRSYQTFNDRLNRTADTFSLLVERIIEIHGQFPTEMDILIGYFTTFYDLFPQSSRRTNQ